MSLNVPKEVEEKAIHGEVTNEDLVAIVKQSLPHAWQIFESAASLLKQQNQGPAIVDPADMYDEKRGQLLRALASNAIRNSLQSHFGCVFAFQNCHRVGAFQPEELDSDKYLTFISPRAQILNQKPELVHC